MRNLLLSIFLYVVPGILALAFGGAYVFLLINEKSVPEGLDTVLKMMIGYFFGAGAASISQTSETEGRKTPPTA